jgi:hypothetical protein
MPPLDGFAPTFPFRLLRAVAARSSWGTETLRDGQPRIVEPDPSWIFDPERLIYWAFVGDPLPAGSPLCGVHRAVYNLERGEIVHQYEGRPFLGLDGPGPRDGAARHESAGPAREGRS